MKATHELSWLRAVDEPCSQTPPETEPAADPSDIPIMPRAMPPPSPLALAMGWMRLRREQPAQLVLLGIARAASQATRDHAGLREIAVCGKEIREARSLVFN